MRWGWGVSKGGGQKKVESKSVRIAVAIAIAPHTHAPSPHLLQRRALSHSAVFHRRGVTVWQPSHNGMQTCTRVKEREAVRGRARVIVANILRRTHKVVNDNNNGE